MIFVGTYTLLDCVLYAKLPTFYCLDVIAWNGVTVADSEFDCRLFMMNSRISENDNFREISKRVPVSSSYFELFVLRSKMPYQVCTLRFSIKIPLWDGYVYSFALEFVVHNHCPNTTLAC